MWRFDRNRPEVKRPPAESKEVDSRVPILTAFLAALITGVFTTYTTFLIVDSQQRVQIAQFQETRTDRQRDIRRDAYVRFLQQSRVFSEARKYRPICNVISAERQASQPICSGLGDTNAAYLSLLDAAVQVRLYGSDDAVKLSKRIEASVDQSRFADLLAAAEDECTGRGGTGLPGIGKQCLGLQRQANEASNDLRAGQTSSDLPRAVDEFGAVVCRELNSVPRGSC